MIARRAPLAAVLGLLLLALLLSISLGTVSIPPRQILDLLFARFRSGGAFPEADPAAASILFEIRLPRTILMALSGAALGGSGAAYQGLFRNPLADPYLLGVAPGAGLGAVAAMAAGCPLPFIPGAALLGALATVALVYALGRSRGGAPATTLVLSGVAVGAFASSLTSLLMIKMDLDLRRVIHFLLGGYGIGGWEPILASLPYLVPGLAGILLLAQPLNLLQFGEEQAAQLGLGVERAKLLIVLAASLTAAAAVAFTGIIGFVGLLVPHLARGLWGPDHRRVIPLSILGGAAILLLADTLGRSSRSLIELPVGVLTAILGAPLLAVLIRRGSRGGL